MTEYYRDARDFLNVQISPEGTVVGKFQTEGDRSSWGSSAGSSTYANGRIITVWDGSLTPYPTTNFSPTYVNDQGNAPPNRITDFVSGSYNVWVLVLGGSGAVVNTFAVQVGSEAEQNIQSFGNPNTATWRQVGTGTYSIDGSTSIQFRYLIPDGYIHAIKAVCLKSTPGTPSQTPIGNQGDLGIITASEYIQGAATVFISGEHIKSIATLGVLGGYIEHLISCNDEPSQYGGDVVYAREGISDTIRYTFSLPEAISWLGMTDEGDLIAVNRPYLASSTVYLCQGVSSVIRTSFFLRENAVTAIAVTKSGDLLSYIGAAVSGPTLYRRFGLTEEIAERYSFNPPFDSGIALDSNDNLIVSAFTTVYIYSGISNILTASFTYEGGTGIALDVSGNLISTTPHGTSHVSIHSGVSATILSSFPTSTSMIVTTQRILIEDAPHTALSYVHSRTYVSGGERNILITAGSSVILVYQGLGGPLSDTYLGPPLLRELALDPSGNLVSLASGNILSPDIDTVYTHVGISSIISASAGVTFGLGVEVADDGTLLINRDDNLQVGDEIFSLAPEIAESGLTRDQSENLIHGAGITNRIYLRPRKSNWRTVGYSFPAPGLHPNKLAVDSQGNLLSTYFFGDTVVIYQHSGVSATIISSFAVGTTSGGIVVKYSSIYAPVHVHVKGDTKLFWPTEWVQSETSLARQGESQLISSARIASTSIIFIHSGISPVVLSSFDMGLEHIQGIDIYGGDLFAFFDFPDPLLRRCHRFEGVSSTFKEIRDLPLIPEGQGKGVALDASGNLIVHDQDKVYVYSGFSGAETKRFTFSLPTGRISGLVVPSTGNLYSSDEIMDRVRTHSGVTGEIVAEWIPTTNEPIDLAVDRDDNFLSMTEFAGAIVYVHDGLTLSITRTFELATTTVGIATRIGPMLEEVRSTTTLLATASSHIVSSCLVVDSQTSYAQGFCLVVPTQADHSLGSCQVYISQAEYSLVSCLVHVSQSAYILGSCRVEAGQFEYAQSSCSVSATQVEYAQGVCQVLSHIEQVDYAQSFALINAVVLESTISSTTVQVSTSSYVLGAATLAISVTGGLVSADSTADKIYLHSGISAIIYSSFSSPAAVPGGLTISSSRGVVSSDIGTGKIYVHSGLSGTIIDSFSAGYASPAGLAVDSSGNLIGCSQLVGDKKIYVHSGITSIILQSFLAPDTSGGGAVPTGLEVDRSGNLVSVVTSGHFWGNQSKISTHSGISGTITSSFENAWLSTSLLLTGLAVDDNDNLISCDVIGLFIRVHDRHTPSIYTSFATPGGEPGALAVVPTITALEFANSLAVILGTVLDYTKSLALVEGAALGFVKSEASVAAGGNLEEVNSSTLLMADVREYVLSETLLDPGGTLEEVSSQTVVQIEAQGYAKVSTVLAAGTMEYCRDSRDFRGMLGAYSGGQGYGYDALSGSWGGSGGHGADYNSARHLTATDPTTNIEDTTFSDTYVNREGFAPPNRVTGFVSGNYFVWIYVNGGTAGLAHGVTVGGNPEVAVASGNNTWQWKQVGTGTYAVTGATQFLFKYKNPDGFLHAIRKLYLKGTPGPPSETPTGNEGDCTVLVFTQTEYTASSTVVLVGAQEYIRSSTAIKVDGSAYVKSDTSLAEKSFVKARAYLNGEDRYEHIVSEAVVLNTALDYAKSRAFLDGEDQRELILGICILSTTALEYVNARAAVNGEDRRDFVVGSAKTGVIGTDYAKGICELDTGTLQDAFTVLQGGLFFLSDTFNVLSLAFTSTLQDSFNVIESVEFWNTFKDTFNIVSTAAAQSKNEDVQIIIVEVV